MATLDSTALLSPRFASQYLDLNLLQILQLVLELPILLVSVGSVYDLKPIFNCLVILNVNKEEPLILAV